MPNQLSDDRIPLPNFFLSRQTSRRARNPLPNNSGVPDTATTTRRGVTWRVRGFFLTRRKFLNRAGLVPSFALLCNTELFSQARPPAYSTVPIYMPLSNIFVEISLFGGHVFPFTREIPYTCLQAR